MLNPEEFKIYVEKFIAEGAGQKPTEEKLMPHIESIRTLRSAKVTYKKITAILQGHAGVAVSEQSLRKFVHERCEEVHLATMDNKG